MKYSATSAADGETNNTTTPNGQAKPEGDPSQSASSGMPVWLWGVIGAGVAAIAAGVIIALVVSRRRRDARADSRIRCGIWQCSIIPQRTRAIPPIIPGGSQGSGGQAPPAETGCRNSRLASRSSHILSRSPGKDSLRRNQTRRLNRLPEFQPLTTMVAMETPADMDGIQGNDHSREGPDRPLLSSANDSRICLYSLTCLSPKLAIAVIGIHMEHIRPTHASMHVRLYSMLTFAFANIISYFFHIHSLHFCYPSATIPFISSRKDVDLSTSLRYNPKY